MFLKEIETRPAEGMTKIAFKKLRDAGEAIPEILHLFRFKRRSTDHLVRFTEEVMRGPSPLSPGMRELIGAYFSRKNQCSFCSDAHAAAAAEFLGRSLSMKSCAIWRLHVWMRRTKSCFVTSANWRRTLLASRPRISTSSKKRVGARKRFMTRSPSLLSLSSTTRGITDREFRT